MQIGFDFFGALLGALSSPAAYLLGREVVGRKLGWALGLACVISATLMYYSQFVRMYNIQAFWVCMAMFWFLKALKTNQKRYWFLTGVAHLMGFYVYVFMVFIFLAQFLIVIFQYRLAIKRYLVPLVFQIPFYVGAMLWMIPTLQRYTQVQETFWTPELTWRISLLTLMSLCGGGDFRGTYWLSAIVLLPLVVGFILGLYERPRNPQILMLGFTAVFVIGTILVLSLGSRWFHDRYLMYVLPSSWQLPLQAG